MIEEWGIRGAIAAGAAVVGAVLRPWVGQMLARREKLRREQRKMMEVWLDLVRQQTAVFVVALARVRNGVEAQQAAGNAIADWVEWGKGNEAIHRHPWEPERIANAELRKLFDELTECKNHMVMYTTAIAREGGRADDFTDSIRKDIDSAERLRKQIVGQMAKAGLQGDDLPHG